jgi:tyrosine-protein kinase Etk/Wzc
MSKNKITSLNEELDPRLFLYVAGKNALWLIFFIGFSLLAAYVYLRYTAPVYESSSIIKIGSENKATKVLSIGNNLGTNNYNEIAGDIELIRSNVIIEKALSKLPLDISYFAKGAVLDNELYKSSPFNVKLLIRDSALISTPVNLEFKRDNYYQLSFLINGRQFSREFKLNEWVKIPYADLKIVVQDTFAIKQQQEIFSQGGYYFVINDSKNLSSQYISNLTVQLLNEQAQTILIKFKDKNAKKAADITNAIAENFIKYNLDKEAESTEKTLVFIEDQLSNVNEQLRYSESLIEAFKKGNKIAKPEALATDVLKELAELKHQRSLLDMEDEVLNRLEKSNDINKDLNPLMALMSGSGANAYLSSIIKSIGSLQDEMESEIIQGGTVNNQSVKIINNKITSLKKTLADGILNSKKSLTERKIILDEKIHLYESNFDKLPAKEAEYVRLERLFAVNEKFYSLLLEKKAEFSITIAGLVTTNLILEAASPSSNASSPNRKLIIGTYLALGILSGLGLIVVKYLLHNEISTIADIKKYTDAAVLGFIPKYKEEVPVSQLIINKNPKSSISEAFRSIRSNLQFISNSKDAKIISISSTVSGEGKTFIAINLAGVIAFAGKKVILLDLDMRKPKIHLGFNVENSKGMSTLLSGNDKLDVCIHKSPLENLDFITAGPVPPNPSELIIGDNLNPLLEHLKTIYDLILIDMPPVGVVTEGIHLMQLSDLPIYVLRAGFTKKMFIQTINNLIQDGKIQKLSLILNGVDVTAGYGKGGYYVGGAYGYTGYGYGYYEEDGV